MESSLQVLVAFGLALSSFLMLFMAFSWWLLPYSAYRKLKASGFSGPKPTFPLGNLNDMNKKATDSTSSLSSPTLSNDIHSVVFPHFARWQKLHGKVFVYWIGTQPFLYIADPEFLKQMSAGITGKSWGKATVFRLDRQPIFGNSLVTVEGEDWARHRHVMTPLFSPTNLKAMASLMVDSTTSMVDRWASLINSGISEIDVQEEIIRTVGETIAKICFGVSHGNGREVQERFRALQITLFKSILFLGVPYGKFLNPRRTLRAKKLGEEIDALLHAIITGRCNGTRTGRQERDVLDQLLEQKKALTTRELMDECKTFFFSGYETTALALSWTLLMLALHPEWQSQLREEIREVIGEGEIVDAIMVAGLKKTYVQMGWVMNEVLRLYSPAPNVQRQARHDIQVGNLVIPTGTNIWIDIVSMHHDHSLWGQDVNEFKPERFKDDIFGGCSHKMGYLPFGFGGRMCVGRNLSHLQYRVVLTLILSKFSFSLSPNYSHSLSTMLSLRPMHGLPLVFVPL